MANNFLALGAFVAFGWLFADTPLPESTSRPAASRATTSEPATPSYAMVNRNVLEARRAPVPLVRKVRASVPSPTAASATAAAAPVPDAEVQAQDDLDRKAAKAAVELDGYKRVTVLGKASNGAWRAKAYRGTTEVRLTVDGTGRVSLE